MSGFNSKCAVDILTARHHPAKRQRVADSAKILLEIAKESSDWCTPLKSVLGGVSALVKQYEVRIERMGAAHNSHTLAAIRRCQGED